MPVAHADGVFGAVVGRELPFKPFEHRSQHELPALDDLLDIGINLRLDIIVLANVPIEINFHAPNLKCRSRDDKEISSWAAGIETAAGIGHG